MKNIILKILVSLIIFWLSKSQEMSYDLDLWKLWASYSPQFQNYPHKTEDFQLVCDLKLANIILGIQSCSSLYSCPYCEGSKVDKDGKPTNGRGCWQPGELRTLRNITANQSEWALKTNSNRKQLKNFKSCEFQPFPSEKIMKMMLFSSNFLQILFMSTT